MKPDIRDPEILLGHVKQVARAMSERFFTKPDDDWEPIAHLVGADSQVRVAPFIMAQLGDTVERSRALETMFLPLVRGGKTTTMSVVLSAWVTSEREFKRSGLRPRENPNREEQLLVLVITRDFTKASFAPIVRRSDQPPTLGEWEDTEGDGGALDGGIIRAIQRSLSGKEENRDGN